MIEIKLCHYFTFSLNAGGGEVEANPLYETVLETVAWESVEGVSGRED